MGKSKSTTNEFILKASAVHNDKYDYSKVEYVNSFTKIFIICKTHGEFLQAPTQHLLGQGCPKCGIGHGGKPKSNTNEFIRKANVVHNNKYDYSKVVYVTQHVPVIIGCPIHGEFLHTPKKHLKYGCNKCAQEVRIAPLRVSKEKIIQRATDVHGNKYDYSKVDYKKTHEKVEIICNKHGVFWQSVQDHVNSGYGCYRCGYDATYQKAISPRKITKEKFLQRAYENHKDKYDYSNIQYVSFTEKIEIICKKHGSFWQSPSDHSGDRAYGCPSCVSNVSRPETEWLDEFNINKKNRNITINAGKYKYRADGYDPATNTVYEFNGDFWHGNPLRYLSNDTNPITKTTFGELYQKTILKESRLKEAGYKVVSIWESDYEKKRKEIA